MKKLLQLAVVAALIKVVYDLVQRQQSRTPLPDGAPFEPAPAPAPKAGTASAGDLGSTDDLTEVNGIGPVYAGRLHDLGITNFAALASADAEAVADGLDVSAAMVADWQTQARDLIG